MDKKFNEQHSLQFMTWAESLTFNDMDFPAVFPSYPTYIDLSNPDTVKEFGNRVRKQYEVVVQGHKMDQADVYIRWLQWGVWSGMFEIKIDGAGGSGEDRAPWKYSQDLQNAFRDVCNTRMGMLSYIYSLANTADDNGVLIKTIGKYISRKGRGLIFIIRQLNILDQRLFSKMFLYIKSLFL